MQQLPPPPSPPWVEMPGWPFEWGSITDVVSILLGLIVLGVTAYIFRRQITIMNEQTALSREQKELSKQQKDLADKQMTLAEQQMEVMKKEQERAERLGRITVRQGEIAEVQHAIMQEQLNRRAALSMDIREKPNLSGVISGSQEYSVVVKNDGNKSCNKLRWTLYLPMGSADRFDFSSEVKRYNPGSPDEWQVRRIIGTFDDTIYPDDDNVVTTFTVRQDIEEEVQIAVAWSIISEDGRVPPDDGVGGSTLTVKQMFS